MLLLGCQKPQPMAVWFESLESPLRLSARDNATNLIMPFSLLQEEFVLFSCAMMHGYCSDVP
jgi:hypothetical protein